MGFERTSAAKELAARIKRIREQKRRMPKFEDVLAERGGLEDDSFLAGLADQDENQMLALGAKAAQGEVPEGVNSLTDVVGAVGKAGLGDLGRASRALFAPVTAAREAGATLGEEGFERMASPARITAALLKGLSVPLKVVTQSDKEYQSDKKKIKDLRDKFDPSNPVADVIASQGKSLLPDFLEKPLRGDFGPEFEKKHPAFQKLIDLGVSPMNLFTMLGGGEEREGFRDTVEDPFAVLGPTELKTGVDALRGLKPVAKVTEKAAVKQLAKDIPLSAEEAGKRADMLTKMAEQARESAEEAAKMGDEFGRDQVLRQADSADLEAERLRKVGTTKPLPAPERTVAENKAQAAKRIAEGEAEVIAAKAEARKLGDAGDMDGAAAAVERASKASDDVARAKAGLSPKEVIQERMAEARRPRVVREAHAAKLAEEAAAKNVESGTASLIPNEPPKPAAAAPPPLQQPSQIVTSPPAMPAASNGLLNRLKRGFQRVLGDREENLAAYLGDSGKAKEAFDAEMATNALREVKVAGVRKLWAKQLTDHGTWAFLSKWTGETGATSISRILRQLPVIGEKFGIGRKRLEALFNASEGIHHMGSDGIPKFGTDIFERDAAGKVLKDAAGKPRILKARYSEAEGSAMWAGLADNEKAAVETWVRRREALQAEYDVLSAQEGYIAHIHETSPLAMLKGFLFKTKSAERRMLRREVGGFSKDFERAVNRAEEGLIKEDLWNKHLERMVNVTTSKEAREGWLVIPKEMSNANGVMTKVAGGGRYIPAELHQQWISSQKNAWEYSAMSRSLRGMGRFLQSNLLLYPGTVARNLFAGGVQYSSMMLEDLYLGALTGNVKRMTAPLRGMIDAFRPSVIDHIPAELFGANVQSQFGKGGGMWDKMTSAALAPYGAIENYWKRAIAASELRARGIPLEKSMILENEKLFSDVSRKVDAFAFNYHNIPDWLTKMRDNPGFALISPFPVYPYKMARLYGRFTLGVLKPGLPWKERVARLLTAATIGYGMSKLFNRDGDKVGGYAGGGYDLDKRGGVRVPGGEAGEERYMRTQEVPFADVGEAMAGVGGEPGEHRDFTDVMGSMVSIGPLPKMAYEAFRERETKPDGSVIGKPREVAVAEQAKTFIPFFRTTEAIKAFMDPRKRNSETFWEELGGAMPAPMPESLQKSHEQKKADGTPKLRDRNLDALKFMFGINMKDIDLSDYAAQLRRQSGALLKQLRSAEGQAQEAELERQLEGIYAEIDRLEGADAER